MQGISSPGNTGLSHSLTWWPDGSMFAGVGTGNGWMVDELMVLNQQSNGNVSVTSGCSNMYFMPQGSGSYLGLNGAQRRNNLQQTGSRFTLSQQQGSGLTQTEFHDFSAPPEQAGRPTQIIPPDGVPITVGGYTSAGITSLERTAGGESYRLRYVYYEDGEHAGNLKEVHLEHRVGSGPWESLRQICYLYYTTGDTHGSLNDLKAAQVKVPDGSGGLVTVSSQYVQYYTSGSPNGSEGQIRLYVGPEAYAELLNQGVDPLDAPDQTAVEAVANLEFTYQGSVVTADTIRNMSDATGAGGQSITRTENPNDPDDEYHFWKTKIVYRGGDNNPRIRYVNYLGQPLLEVLQEDGTTREWGLYNRYNAQGLVDLTADPASIESYDENQDDLGVVLKASEGLIEEFVYFTQTTATRTVPGGVADRLSHRFIRKGTGGTIVMASRFEYLASVDSGYDGSTVYTPGREWTYPTDTSDLNGGEVTEYTVNSWYSSPSRIQERTITRPGIPEDQNGTGEDMITREYYDEQGRLRYFQNALGRITAYEYSPANGLLVRQIEDADQGPWLLGPGPYANKTTDYSYDPQGRRIEVLEAEHEAVTGGSCAELVRKATWTVYRQAETEDQVWTGKGYVNSEDGSETLIDPVRIVFKDKSGRTTNEISAARSGGSGRLLPGDRFARSVWFRWSRKTYDVEGRVETSRTYHQIPAQ
ncbi:MAG: hypothetical protein AAF492_08135, partial [Verrucomicrobiota bacterium]